MQLSTWEDPPPPPPPWDEGCAALASALRGGTRPALKELPLYDNLASFEAEETMYDARDGLSNS